MPEVITLNCCLGKIGGMTLGKIGEWLVDPIGRQFGYLFCFNRNIENLETQFKKLETTRQDVQLMVDEAKRNVRTIGPDVEAWVTSANEAITEVDKIIQDKAEVQKGCLHGWCPNLKLRYSVSRKATKKTPVVADIRADGINHTKTSYSPPPPSTVSIPTRKFMKFESRMSSMNQIIEALKDDKINLIGICGMAGVGKTTMVKQVAKRVQEENHFHEVAMVVVGREPNLAEVQMSIAVTLGLKLDMKSPMVSASMFSASRLHERLQQKEKKKLVILDDVWAEFDLEDLGIPLEDGNKDCKILYTSRNRDLWRAEKNKRDIPLDILSDVEARCLFKEKAHLSTDASHDLQQLAEDIVNECGRLPLALVTIGSALTNKSKEIWREALRQLRMPYSETFVSGVSAQVYQSLEFSYKELQDKTAKSLLLLCCLFEEDHNIPIEDLVRYGFTLYLFGNINRLGEARDRVCFLVDKLKSSHLLLDGDKDNNVKMHDVVRDVALSIVSRDGEHGFTICHGEKSREWPKETYEGDTSILLASRGITELPQGLRILCPRLQLLLVECNHYSLKTQDNFFEGMAELKVLDLQRTCIPSLPPSLGKVNKLQMLCLYHCNGLKNISVIGELSNLEILSLRSSPIKELPEEIGRLANLRLLDLRDCFRLDRIPVGVISSLVQLQELYMRGSKFRNWGQCSKEGINASLVEFKLLPNLGTLEIQIRDVAALPAIPIFSKLTNYKILIGIGTTWLEDERIHKQLDLRLHTCSIPSKCGINLLIKSTESLYLAGESSKDLLNELVGEGVNGLQHLKHLTISQCDTPECLANTAFPAPVVFPILEHLQLYGLHNLSEIFHGPLAEGSFGKLSFLRVSDCHKFENLFQLSIARGLGQLQKLYISQCDMMEEVIWKGRGEVVHDATNKKIEFPNLKEIELWNLPSLVCFCRGIDEIDFPQLKRLSLNGLPKLECLFPNKNNLFSDSEENHNAAFLSIFPQKVAFPSLEILQLQNLQNMNEIWYGQLLAGSFSKLMELDVSDCRSLRNLFSPSMARYLVHLRKVIIHKCWNMEVVVAEEEEEEKGGMIDETMFPKLKHLELEDLPLLRSFCHFTQTWELPLVRYMTAINCHNMTTFSPGFLRTPNLQRVLMQKPDYTFWRGDLNNTILHNLNRFENRLFRTGRERLRLREIERLERI